MRQLLRHPSYNCSLFTSAAGALRTARLQGLKAYVVMNFYINLAVNSSGLVSRSERRKQSNHWAATVCYISMQLISYVDTMNLNRSKNMTFQWSTYPSIFLSSSSRIHRVAHLQLVSRDGTFGSVRRLSILRCYAFPHSFQINLGTA
jgi:hypothetical protein